MINKKSLWFLTLFSLILVLSIYYITMPSELLLTGNTVNNNDKNIVFVKQKAGIGVKQVVDEILENYL